MPYAAEHRSLQQPAFITRFPSDAQCWPPVPLRGDVVLCEAYQILLQREEVRLCCRERLVHLQT